MADKAQVQIPSLIAEEILIKADNKQNRDHEDQKLWTSLCADTGLPDASNQL